MQWVVVLTVLTLYACAIVFTSLVGKGYMTGGVVEDEAEYRFGSVAKSMFSLFKLMNGDTTVVAPITSSVQGQLLFAGFMVVANWAILAILTSVVSDNMISSSARANEEDEKKQREEAHEHRVAQLQTLFKEIDTDGSGAIEKKEWDKMLEDKGLRQTLLDATGLGTEDLVDYFNCLSIDVRQQHRQEIANVNIDRRLPYHLFIENLKNEGVVADKRSVL